MSYFLRSPQQTVASIDEAVRVLETAGLYSEDSWCVLRSLVDRFDPAELDIGEAYSQLVLLLDWLASRIHLELARSISSPVVAHCILDSWRIAHRKATSIRTRMLKRETTESGPDSDSHLLDAPEEDGPAPKEIPHDVRRTLASTVSLFEGAGECYRQC
jgi:hypothetical protein